LARTLATAVARVIPGAALAEIELASLGSRVLEPDDQSAAAAVEQVVESDLLVLSSPTYKAAYSGLLKSFLDRLDHKGLTGKSAVPILLGGLPDHRLSIDVHFSPLLLELGAKVPAGGLFVLESEVADFPSFAAGWADTYAATLVAASAAAALSRSIP
jgi:FMN reductase